MDTNGIIREHSKQKLELYRLYLERYLAVLLVVSHFDSIWIHDVFAGSGYSKNNEEGSAVIAANVIQKISKSQNPKNKIIRLCLNDAKPANVSLLRKHMQPFKFATIQNCTAEEYIQSWNPQQSSHNLFFLDPHGYSQISFQNRKSFFASLNRDFLIFIPIYHIYRFLKKDKDAELKPLEEQLAPIEDFLKDIGIDSSESAGSLEVFSDLIVTALKGISGTSFVYKQIIDNKERNSRYGLFFTSHSILGADKFLEAQEKLKKAIEQGEAQIAFDFIEEENIPSILDVLKTNKPYSNIELYKIGIELGLRANSVLKQLKKLEAEGKIEVTPVAGKKRKRKGFYIGYDHYKKDNKIIMMRRT